MKRSFKYEIVIAVETSEPLTDDQLGILAADAGYQIVEPEDSEASALGPVAVVGVDWKWRTVPYGRFWTENHFTSDLTCLYCGQQVTDDDEAALHLPTCPARGAE